jgi:hypothetical protein
MTSILVALVALVVAVALPVSQLRTHVTIHKCCCPDPSNCHCPKDKKAPVDGSPSIAACHSQDTTIVSPGAPVVVIAMVVQYGPLERNTSLLVSPARRPAPFSKPAGAIGTVIAIERRTHARSMTPTSRAASLRAISASASISHTR